MFNNDFNANILMSVTVKGFWNSITIWRSYRQKSSVLVFWFTVYIPCMDEECSTLTSNVNNQAIQTLLTAWSNKHNSAVITGGAVAPALCSQPLA